PTGLVLTSRPAPAGNTNPSPFCGAMLPIQFVELDQKAFAPPPLHVSVMGPRLVTGVYVRTILPLLTDVENAPAVMPLVPAMEVKLEFPAFVAPPESDMIVQLCADCQNGVEVSGAVAEPMKPMSNREEPPRVSVPPVREI